MAKIEEGGFRQYSLEVRKTGANAKCRVCRRNIYRGQLAVFVKQGDGYNEFNMCAHPDCFLEYIIREVKKIKMDELRKEYAHFDRIDKLLREK